MIPSELNFVGVLSVSQAVCMYVCVRVCGCIPVYVYVEFFAGAVSLFVRVLLLWSTWHMYKNFGEGLKTAGVFANAVHWCSYQRLFALPCTVWRSNRFFHR